MIEASDSQYTDRAETTVRFWLRLPLSLLAWFVVCSSVISICLAEDIKKSADKPKPVTPASKAIPPQEKSATTTPKPSTSAPTIVAPATKPVPEVSLEEIEPQVLDFVKQHHPELVSLLQLLKSMNEMEYETAVREINKVLNRLSPLQKRDPELYTIELEAWKVQSKIDLTLARAVAQTKEVEVDVLDQLVRRQIELQKKRLRHERNLLSARQQQLKESLEKLEADEEAKVKQSVASLQKKIQFKLKKSTPDVKTSREQSKP